RVVPGSITTTDRAPVGALDATVTDTLRFSSEIQVPPPTVIPVPVMTTCEDRRRYWPVMVSVVGVPGVREVGETPVTTASGISRTKMSPALFVSSETMLVANDQKAT